MANSIELIKSYGAGQLDDIFMAVSKTAILEGGNDLLKFVNAKTVLIPSIVMEGLGDYSRSTGFPKGDVSLTWDPYALTQDRGKEFTIDAMDNEETAGLAFGKLASEFERTKVIPEVDAYRLSTLYAKAKTENVTTETLTAKGILSRFNADDKLFDDNEIDNEGQTRIRFISSEVDKFLKDSEDLTKMLSVDTYNIGKDSEGVDINVKVRSYNGVALISVPKTRFKTSYTFGTNGFTAQEDAKEINFLTVDKRAAIPVKKHEKIRVFSPDENQDADAWKFQYRLYHDIFTPKNKTLGITASIKA